MTLEQQLRRAINALRQSSPSASLDAEVLAMLAFGRDRAGLIRDGKQATSAADAQRFQEFVERRLNGEPIAYITGEREFWSLAFTVDPSVLIPRADTELLVERALSLIDRLAGNGAQVHAGTDQTLRIADLGTGSGAIAITLAHERPECEVIATDICQSALDVARGNARRHDIRNLTFRCGSWVAAIADLRVDLIVSNPPYIAANDPHLSLGDVAHEPDQALVSGIDGLEALRTIIESAPQILKRDGYLLLEHGYDQGAQVRELCASHSFRNIQSHMDLAGQERTTEAQLG